MGFQSPGHELEPASTTDWSDNQGPADLLTLGFGTTLAMWAIGYVCRLPGLTAPPPVVLPLLLAALLGGGVVAGRYSRRRWRAGLYAGLIAALLNLLILGSLLTENASADIKHAAGLWVASFFGAAGLLGAVGGVIGQAAAANRTINWKAAFAGVALVAAVLLILAGGLVTGFNAGLAVPDWPNSFQVNMFLFPLSKMTGGIYFEHTHRLFGALLGFTVLALAIYLLRFEKRRWVTALVWAVGCMVLAQAALGGWRVVAKLREVAIIHGVFAQLILGALAAVTILCSRRFSSPAPAIARPGAALDHLFSRALVAALMVQLLLGALVRHENLSVLLHISFAVLVAGLALVVGMRAVALNEGLPVLRRLGLALLVLVGLQVMAGITALALGGYGDITPGGGVPQPTAAQAVATTLHQTNGALLLMCAVAIGLWSQRLLAEPREETRNMKGETRNEMVNAT